MAWLIGVIVYSYFMKLFVSTKLLSRCGDILFNIGLFIQPVIKYYEMPFADHTSKNHHWLFILYLWNYLFPLSYYLNVVMCLLLRPLRIVRLVCFICFWEAVIISQRRYKVCNVMKKFTLSQYMFSNEAFLSSLN